MNLYELREKQKAIITGIPEGTPKYLLGTVVIALKNLGRDDRELRIVEMFPEPCIWGRSIEGYECELVGEHGYATK